MVGIMILHVSANPAVPAIYVFGDSTADVGTNNYLAECGAKVNFPHHGIDYPGSKPTGRFSNGYNSIDFLAQFLGFEESPPPFLYLLRKDKKNFMRNVLNGANFASGGAGLLGITGKRPYKRVISVAEQVQQFAKVRNAYTKLLGNQAEDRLSKSLFLISVGSNDIFEYFLYNQTQIKSENFISTLLYSYEYHLRGLLRLGAKRLGIVSVTPIGCCPIIRIRSENEECSDTMNAFAKKFNLGLEALLKKLSTEGAKPMKYSIAKSYDMTLSVLNDPLSYNFKDGKSACCGNGGRLNAEERCKPDSKVCKDRNALLFWDQFHPTEVAFKLAAMALYGGGDQHIAPMNISQLAILKF
ncbi:GDSL esterase/lipase [Morus notabilis]|uniref:GDSL esterase/lipase n=2 Tax=Morus notabilis TaxID=981085 RepID=W9T0L0_9ROSA|nr:GDSL esterase/lipase [Morus notabilis]